MSKQLSPTDVGIEVDFMRRKQAELAREIVMGLEDASKLALGVYGLTELQWEVLKRWPSFVQKVREAQEELSGYSGTMTRIQRMAALSVAEFCITDLTEIAGNKKAPTGDRLDAIKQLRETAGATGKGSNGGGHGTMPIAQEGATVIGSPLINIIMPDPSKITVKPAPVIEGEYKRVEAK